MDTKTLSEQRLDRLMKAIRHEKPDRTPLQFNGNVTFLRYVDPGATVGAYVRDPVGSTKKILAGIGKLDNIDSLSGLGMWPGTMGAVWFSKMKLPGRELAEDDLWQLDEKAFMTREDYDVILNKGWDWFYNDVVFNRLGYREEDFEYGMQVMMECDKLTQEAGFPSYSSGIMYQCVVDKLTSGRGTVNFFRDIKQIPDKLKEVIKIMTDAETAKVIQMFGVAPKGTVATVTPAIRCTCDYISEKVFEEFIWPAMSEPAQLIIDNGYYVFFHNDSNWDDFLHFYKQFPKKTCIYDSDGQTDIYKVKEILGDSMCITGNVSASLLALGTPDEVYDFCKKQIADMGDAYILTSSCSLPPNAKPENIEAMNAAVV